MTNCILSLWSAKHQLEKNGGKQQQNHLSDQEVLLCARNFKIRNSRWLEFLGSSNLVPEFVVFFFSARAVS